MLENNELYKSILQSLKDEQKKVKDNFEKFESESNEYKEVSKNVVEFLRKQSIDNEIDFELLDKFIDYLVKEEYLPEKKDYKKLQQLKLKLMADFADRTEKIDKEFSQLLSVCERIKNEQVSKAKNFQRKSYKYKSDLEYYTQVEAILKSISEEKFISTDELKVLKEYMDTKNFADDEDAVQLFQEIIVHNAAVLENQYNQVLANIEAKRKAKEKQKKKVKKETKKQKSEQGVTTEHHQTVKTPAADVVKKEKKPKEKKEKQFKLDLKDKRFKEAYDRVYELLETSFEANEVFLSFVVTENLDFESALIMVDAIGDPLTNIKSLLEEKVMPAIEAGEVDAYKELLFLYLEEYDKYVEKLDWKKKLQDNDNSELAKMVQEGKQLLDVCEQNNLLERINMLKGYLMPVENRVNAVLEHVLSGKPLDDNLLKESEQELSGMLPALRRVVEPYIPKDESELGVYKNASNLILLPENVSLDEMIEKEGQNDPNALAIVVNGLETLANDENIIVTYAHRVQHNREKTEIKSHRKGDWRIFYKVTKADNLEKVFHKKMNAIYIVDIGFGSNDGKTKSRMVDRAYNASVEREAEFDKFVEILNSDDLDKTMDLLVKQTAKFKEYVKKSEESSLGGDPSAK